MKNGTVRRNYRHHRLVVEWRRLPPFARSIAGRFIATFVIFPVLTAPRAAPDAEHVFDSALHAYSHAILAARLAIDEQFSAEACQLASATVAAA